ncbi:hypothetical protein DXG03_000617 [Asterophora parasitica]|uniref:Uncharacterized protein n=1 Tax=Asterophora parasitica TaxID=117018 RepID=A0A9P7G657_9AGAR|nr:hypothetical protein DXG03_000617 [Asterophora parasitica]
MLHPMRTAWEAETDQLHSELASLRAELVKEKYDHRVVIDDLSNSLKTAEDHKAGLEEKLQKAEEDLAV